MARRSAWPSNRSELYTPVRHLDQRGSGEPRAGKTANCRQQRGHWIPVQVSDREGPGTAVRRYRGQVFVGSQQSRRIAAVLIAASLALLAGCQGSSSDASAGAVTS